MREAPDGASATEHTASSSETGAAGSSAALPSGRLLGVAALLLGEYLYLSYRFDAKTIARQAGSALPEWLSHAGTVAPFAVVVAAAVVLFSGSALRAELLRALGPDRLAAPHPAFALLHLACYALLVHATQHIFAPGASAPDERWVALWLFGAAGTLLTVLPLALPVAVVRRLLPRIGRPLALGLLAGTVAFAAGLASTLLWTPLSQATLHVVVSLLHLFAMEVVFVPEEAVVGLPEFVVTVAPICSGYEGIGLALVFTAIYLWTSRDELRFPNAFGLIPLALVSVWFANAVRIALLIAVGALLSPEVALGGFHSKAGWLLFCGVALGLTLAARRLRFFAREVDAAAGPNPAAPYLLPLLALLATMLVTGLFAIDFDWLYPLRVAAVAAVLWRYRERLPPLFRPFSLQAPLLGVIVYALWVALVPAPAGGAQGAAFSAALHAHGPAAAAAWLAFRTIGSAITVPIAEELAFRGYLLRRLMHADFTAADPRRFDLIAVAVSSLAFGALHQAWLPGILAGLIFAYAQQSRGRLSDAIVAHATANALLAADALLRDRYWLWA